jgi:hypothetical protein
MFYARTSLSTPAPENNATTVAYITWIWRLEEYYIHVVLFANVYVSEIFTLKLYLI